MGVNIIMRERNIISYAQINNLRERKLSRNKMHFVVTNSVYVLKETSNAKSALVLLEWTHCLCLRFVLYGMRLVNTLSLPCMVHEYCKVTEQFCIFSMLNLAEHEIFPAQLLVFQHSGTGKIKF